MTDWASDLEGTPTKDKLEEKDKCQEEDVQDEKRQVPALKARNWTVKKHNAKVYASEDLSGEPIGYLAQHARLVALNRDENTVAVEHEEGFTHMDDLIPHQPELDSANVAFSHAPHRHCCNGEDLEVTLWWVVKYLLVGGVVVFYIFAIGTLFILGNSGCPTHMKQNSIGQYIFWCHATHPGWTPQALEHDQYIDFITQEIRKTWDVSQWKIIPKNLNKYTEVVMLQRLRDHSTDTSVREFIASVNSEEYLGYARNKIHKYVDEQWHPYRDLGIPVNRFIESMFRECPKPIPCPEPEPCPSECPTCPVRYSSVASAATNDGFCVPCPVDSTKTVQFESSPSKNNQEFQSNDDECQTSHLDDIQLKKMSSSKLTDKKEYQPQYVSDPSAVLVPKAGRAYAIPVNEVLPSNHAIFSKDHLYMMVMQPDCNLVVYKMTSNKAVWSSQTNGKGGSGTCEFRLKPKSAQIIDTKTGDIVWSFMYFMWERDVKEIVVTETGPQRVFVS